MQRFINSSFLILSATSTNETKTFSAFHSLFFLNTFTRILVSVCNMYYINIQENNVDSANFSISTSQKICILLSHTAKHFH